MEQQQSPSASQSQLTQVGLAPVAQALVLRLHTAGAANNAYLEQDDGGRVHLYFRGLRFAVDDYVPDSLAGRRSRSPCSTAGQFICRQMLTHHGYHEDAWPDLARLFLSQHEAVQYASRPQSRR